MKASATRVQRVFSILGLAAILVFAAANALPVSGAQSGDDRNVVPNPSFEDMNGAVPAGWQIPRYRGGAELTVDAVAHSGKQSIRISSAKGSGASWTAVVPVKPFSKYRLSGWIKTADVTTVDGKGAQLAIQGMEALQTAPLTGTRDWTRVELVIDTDANDGLRLNCALGDRGNATGTAWYDDVRMELLSSRALKPRVSVDASKTLTPMSKYIYGQFIEHLGRCIYQGIWAEMLEDRKFYYPIGDKESPWKVVGTAENVRMNPILPYVGVHAPEIRMPGGGEAGGIMQENLALIQGRNYVGRAVLAVDPEAVPVEVSLVWGPGESERQAVKITEPTVDYKTYPLAFKAGATTDKGRLEIASRGSESFLVGTVSLMPADNVEGFRPEVLKALKELNAPVYRWPGGNFVSGYFWEDGIGDPDRRPPRKNPAWTGVEHNDVGVHEFMNFCRLLGTEPYIAVNSGQGSETQAARLVEYVNGKADTPMGKLRALNGRAEPWGCPWWSIGNEMYGNWQLGHMPVKDYVKKHNRFAAAMRAKDPSIKLIAVGDPGPWDELMMATCADSMNLISEHFYAQEGAGLMSHVNQIPNHIKRMVRAHQEYRRTIPALKGKDIRIAMDEWNYWYGPHIYGELGTQYFLKDALGIAAGLNEYARNTDMIFMANYAQTVNVIGAIKTTKTEAVLDSTGVVLKLYRERFGTLPVRVNGTPEPLNVMATWREGKKVLTVSIINPTHETQALSLDIKGASLPKTARWWLMTGSDEKACNVPGKAPQVFFKETKDAPFGTKLAIPAMSVSLYEVEVR
jgi:alpha-L-arabinofuranosidase